MVAKGKFWLVLLCSLISFLVEASGYVIVTSSDKISELTPNQIKMLYRGLITHVNGQTIQLADLPAHSQIRDNFYLSLLGKTPVQMQVLRARQSFSGKNIPPYELKSADQHYVMSWLNQHPNSVMYLPTSWDTGALTVIYRINSEEEK